MLREQRIEQEVMKTLQYLDKVEEIESSPFFYARVNARINTLDRSKKPRLGILFDFPVYRTAFIVFLILINVISAIIIIQRSGAQDYSRSQIITDLADTYSLTHDSVAEIVQYPTLIHIDKN